jgi:hypothetical protein
MTVLQDAINRYTNGVIQDFEYLQMYHIILVYIHNITIYFWIIRLG